MVFSSLFFLFVFLPITLIAQHFAADINLKNKIILAASLFFYAWGEPKWIFAMILVSFIDYGAGLLIDKNRNTPKAKAVVAGASVLTLGALIVFKYLNFFTGNIDALFGTEIQTNISLPIGISFYTFQALSYVVDVYRGDVKCQKTYYKLLLYVCMFPQLIAGPIVRYSDIEKEINKRKVTYRSISNGITRFVIGLFKKAFFANLLGEVATLYLDGNLSKTTFVQGWIGIIAYFFQIYFDFSGYSDVACGTCRLLGFEPMLNFDRPYLSKSFSEFWRRWHISLSFWFRDYVYIPLGGSRVPFWKIVRNLWIVFLLSGLWHGAAWTFVIWGGLHALFQTLGLIKRKVSGNAPPSQKLSLMISKVLMVNLGVTFAWIFFRAHSFAELKSFMSVLLSGQWKFNMMSMCAANGPMTMAVCCLSVLLLALSYLTPRDCAFKTTQGKFLFTLTCAAFVVLFGIPCGGEFIYFQF